MAAKQDKMIDGLISKRRMMYDWLKEYLSPKHDYFDTDQASYD